MSLDEKIKRLDNLASRMNFVAVAHHYQLNESTIHCIKNRSKEIRMSVATSSPGSAKRASDVVNLPW